VDKLKRFTGKLAMFRKKIMGRSSLWEPLFPIDSIAALAVILFLELLCGVGVAIAPMQSFMAMVGLAIFVLMFLKPSWGYLLTLIFIPLRSQEYTLVHIGPADLRISDVFAVPAILGWLFASMFVHQKRIPYEKTAIGLPILLLFFWTLLSCTWAASITSSISKVIQFTLGIFFVYLSINLIKDEKFLNSTISAWLLAGLMVGIVSIIQRGGGITKRIESIQMSSLETGEYLNYCIILGIIKFLDAKSIAKKLVVLFMVSMVLIGTSLSVARGPLVGLSAAALFLVYKLVDFKKIQRKILISLVMVIIAVFCISVAGVFLQPDILIDSFTRIWGRFNTAFTSPEDDFGVMWRMALWSACYKIILDHPIIGIGIGSFPKVSVEYMAEGHNLCHNLYLEILVPLGLIGFSIFLWLVVRLIKLIKNVLAKIEDARLRLFTIGFAALLVSKAFSGLTYGYLVEDKALWLVIGLGLAIIKLGYEKQAEIEEREI